LLVWLSGGDFRLRFISNTVQGNIPADKTSGVQLYTIPISTPLIMHAFIKAHKILKPLLIGVTGIAIHA